MTESSCKRTFMEFCTMFWRTFKISKTKLRSKYSIQFFKMYESNYQNTYIHTYQYIFNMSYDWKYKNIWLVLFQEELQTIHTIDVMLHSCKLQFLTFNSLTLKTVSTENKIMNLEIQNSNVLSITHFQRWGI